MTFENYPVFWLILRFSVSSPLISDQINILILLWGSLSIVHSFLSIFIVFFSLLFLLACSRCNTLSSRLRGGKIQPGKRKLFL